VPIERRSTRSQTTTLVISLVAVVVVVILGFLVIRAASGSGDGVSLNLGDDVFEAGGAKVLAGAVAADGPLLFSDVAGRGQRRPIFVSHLGDSEKAGWYAFDAFPRGAPEGCFLEWDATTEQFTAVDDCVAGTFPVDGTGLRRYEVTVTEDDQLEVDLRKELDEP
jgi:hypothetical protein